MPPIPETTKNKATKSTRNIFQGKANSLSRPDGDSADFIEAYAQNIRSSPFLESSKDLDATR